MKKIFFTFLLFISVQAFAEQIVPIVWPYSMASTQANALRLIIENANSSQSKYQFVLEAKPGAGGAIAVNHVLNQKTPTLLMNSSSVFIRPLYYPNESYDVSMLQPVVVVSNEIPLVLLSKNVQDVEDLKKKSSITIAVVPGTIIEASAKTVGKSFNNTEFRTIPYSTGSVDGTRDVMGGFVDTSIEYIKNALPWIESGSLKAIAITGRKNYGNIKTFSSYGVKGLEDVVAANFIIASKKMSADQVKEFHEILSEAMIKKNVVDIWQSDVGHVTNRTLKETINFWNNESIVWRNAINK
jgi:tripartite-type tricarboxylate transporter receptor subunit TctC